MGQEHDSWIAGVLGVDVATIRKTVGTVVRETQKVVEPVIDGIIEEVSDVISPNDAARPLASGAGKAIKAAADTVKKGVEAAAAASGAMTPACKPVKGYVPGPASHLLCKTHGHILDVGSGMIIAASLEDYKRRFGVKPASGGAPRPGAAAPSPAPAAAASRATKECRPVKGFVPGPAEHLLCKTHGHIINVKTGEIVATSLDDYERRGAAKAAPAAEGMFMSDDMRRSILAPKAAGAGEARSPEASLAGEAFDGARRGAQTASNVARSVAESVVGAVQSGLRALEQDPSVVLADSGRGAPVSRPGDIEDEEAESRRSSQKSSQGGPTSFPGDTDPPEIEKDWDDFTSGITNGVIEGAKFIGEKIIVGGIGKLVGVPGIALPIGLDSDESPDQRAARKKAEQEADEEGRREAEDARRRDADFEQGLAEREQQRRIDEQNQRLNPIKSVNAPSDGNVVRASDEAVEMARQAAQAAAEARAQAAQAVSDAAADALDAGLRAVKQNPGALIDSLIDDED